MSQVIWYKTLPAVFLKPEKTSEVATRGVLQRKDVLRSGPRPATLLKKRLRHRCFPVNFVKFLRTPLNDCFYILFKTSWSLINQPIKKFVFTEFLFSFTILSKRKLRMHRIANLRSKHALLVEN